MAAGDLRHLRLPCCRVGCCFVYVHMPLVTAIGGVMQHIRSAHKVIWEAASSAQRLEQRREWLYRTSHSAPGTSFLGMPAALKPSLKKMAAAEFAHVQREQCIVPETAHARDARLCSWMHRRPYVQEGHEHIPRGERCQARREVLAAFFPPCVCGWRLTWRTNRDRVLGWIVH